jgi:release factor glutamine methyltransferase
MAETIALWLAHAEDMLRKAGIGTARLDSLVLLSDELGRDKSWLLAHSEDILQSSELENLSTKIAQRTHHTPLAYLRGKAEFYGREFVVNEHILVPRPESEAMIELLKELVPASTATTIIDVGTGSGCLAITAKLELPQSIVFAIDIDPNCLSTAQINAKTLGAEVTLLLGDLLSPIQYSSSKMRDSIVLANLPYVPENYSINTAATHEPKLALFSGKDGLGHYRKLFGQLRKIDHKPTILVTEALLEQHTALVKIAKDTGYALAATKGLAQAFTLSRP